MSWKLWDTFTNSTSTIFDYARGIHRHTPERKKDIEEMRERLIKEGVNLPPIEEFKKPEKPS